MSTIKNESYIQISGWMVNELGLKGNELIVYAAIYGFSQDGKSKYCGSRQYLADWCNSTTRGIQKTLNTLVEKKLLEKQERVLNNIKYCEYIAVIPKKPEENNQEPKEDDTRELSSHPQGTQFPTPGNSVPTPRELSSPNNIVYNIDNNIDNNIYTSSEEDTHNKKDTIDYDNIMKQYNDKCVNLTKIIKMSDRRKKAVKSIIKQYSLEDVLKVFDIAAESWYLNGQTTVGDWQANFDWIMKPANFLKVLEGNYANSKFKKKQSGSSTYNNNKFNDFEQREGIDWKAREEALRNKTVEENRIPEQEQFNYEIDPELNF